MKYTPTELGRLVKATRTTIGVTQEKLALAAGTGLRFIIDLEKGKATCQLSKTLTVLSTLGLELTIELPSTDRSDDSNGQQDNPS